MRDPRMEIIEGIVGKALPLIDRHDTVFACMVVALAAALYTGPDIKALASFTGYSKTRITDMSTRMHACGLWEKGIVHFDGILKRGKVNAAGLLAAGMVARGELVAERRPNGVWTYLDPNHWGLCSPTIH